MDCGVNLYEVGVCVVLNHILIHIKLLVINWFVGMVLCLVDFVDMVERLYEMIQVCIFLILLHPIQTKMSNFVIWI